MALFELDNGRLVPAQFGREITGGFTPQVLHAVRGQVLEIVSRPLFPITWGSAGELPAPQDLPRLTALDASGQVVAVEVVEELDADLLIESLSRLADTAAMSWVDLARKYPGGVEGFKVDWTHFREAMPPTTPNGPRLVIVAASIDPEVRPALDVLASSGVEVHEMTLRQMTNGRAFLDVSAVGPRTYGHRANLLVGDAQQTPAELQQKVARKAAPVRDARPLTSAAPLASEPPAADVLQRRQAPRVARRTSTKMPYPSRMARRADTGAIPALQQPLAENAGALATVARMVGRPTPLVLSPQFGLQVEARLSPTGSIRMHGRDYIDPTAALQALGFGGSDGWDAWHLGDAYGPTLAEAVAEINRGR